MQVIHVVYIGIHIVILTLNALTHKNQLKTSKDYIFDVLHFLNSKPARPAIAPL